MHVRRDVDFATVPATNDIMALAMNATQIVFYGQSLFVLPDNQPNYVDCNNIMSL